MAIAANSVIAQPLRISLRMVCPVNSAQNYSQKQAIMTGLQATLKNHCQNGGVFAVATPSLYYPDVLLEAITEVSAGETGQAQVVWRWDFKKPLISQADAAVVQNAMMSAISGGLPTSGALSGAGAVSPTAAASSGVMPAAAASSAASISGAAPSLGGAGFSPFPSSYSSLSPLPSANSSTVSFLGQ
jgi:hypothetical protein